MRRFLRAARLVGPALLVAVLAGACHMPVFDEALSAAYSSAKKMRHDATIGPYKMWEGDFSRYSEVRFLPKKMPNPDGGFLLRLRDGEYRIGYTQRNFGGWAQSETSITGAAAPYATNAFNAAAGVVTGSSPLAGFLAYFVDADPNPSFNNLRRADIGSIIPAGGAYDRNVITDLQTDVPVGPPPTIISGRYLPNAAPNRELFQVFAYDANTPGYIEMQYLIDSTFLSSTLDANLVQARFASAILPAANLPFNLRPTSGFYFYSPATGRSYLSSYETNRWVTYCWYNDSGLRFKQLASVGKLSAVLSTGELFVESSSSGEVYNPDGGRKYSIALGGMRLAHEMYENGAYRMVFVQRLMFSGNGDDQGQWEVYSIPTVDLKNLD